MVSPSDEVIAWAIESGRNQSVAQGHDAVRCRAVGFAYSEALEQAMFDHPRGHDLAGGIDDAAEGALWSNRIPLRSARIDTFQMMAV